MKIFGKTKQNKNKKRSSFDGYNLSWKNIKNKNENEPSWLRVKFKTHKLFLDFIFKKITVIFGDHLFLLLRSAAQNHLRIEKCRKIKTGDSCSLDFGSYSELKRYQKKVKIFTYSFSSTLSFALIVAIVGQIFFLNSGAQGATYFFSQTNWSGGQSATNASHPADSNGWTKYGTKDAGITTANGGADLKLTVQNSSVLQTSNNGNGDSPNVGGFNAGTKSNTAVGGAETNAFVELGREFAQIKLGSQHTVALKKDGTVWAWGDNTASQLGDGTTNSSLNPRQVPGLINIRAIDTAGGYNASGHVLALKSDGTVWAWGQNAFGQLGDNSTNGRMSPVQVSGLTGVVAISAGSAHSLAIKSDGTVWAWGNNDQGQLGDNTQIRRSVPVQVLGLTNVTAIAAGGDPNYYSGYSIALKSDGTVWSWGLNNYGQLGDNTFVNKSVPVQVSGLSGISSISAGFMHSMALKSDNTVWSWGGNLSGQLGDNTTTSRNIPVQVSGLTNVISISAAGCAKHSMAIKKDGTVWVWGDNSFGQLGDNSTVQKNAPIQVGGLTGMISVSAGLKNSIAVENDGTVQIWGDNTFGQIGDDTIDQKLTPVQPYDGTPSAGLVASTTAPSNTIAAGGKTNYGGNSASIGVDGSVSVWGIWGGTNRRTPAKKSGLTGMTAIKIGQEHTLALKNDGTVWAWGTGTSGQLGNGGAATSYTPVQVSGLTGIASVSAGSFHSLALKNDGTVWAWGGNNYGQLGDNSTTQRNSPVQIMTDVKAISAGSYHSLVVKNDGTVWAWGSNSSGQLGNGGTTQSNVPVQVTGLTGFNSVSGGGDSNYPQYSFSMALKSDGTVWAWGYNAGGQLGDNSFSTRLLPVQVLNLTNVTNISAGSYHSLAVKNDGTAWAWGSNSQGELGINSNTSSFSVPQQISTLTGVAAVSAGPNHSLAIKSDGTVWSWGFNNTAQLGNNTLINVKYPIRPVSWVIPDDYLNIGETYLSSGTFTSTVLDMTQKADYGVLNYGTSVPAGSVLTIDMRAGNVSVPDSSWTAWQTNISSGTDISALDANRYVQYRLNFSTTDLTKSPVFNDISFGYSLYPTSATLTSSAYNTSSPVNLLNKIRWTATTTSANSVKFQLRTAPDNTGSPGVWTNWVGPDGSSTSYFIDPAGGEAIPVLIGDSSNDQWIQYKAFFASDGASTPTLSDVSLTYVVNAPPEINITNSVSQNSDGLVSVSYQVRDPDTATGTTHDSVVASLQYCTANCTNPGSETWTDATSVSGGVGVVAVNDNGVDYNNYQIVWNPKAEYDNHYNQNMKVRVKVNDSETANNLAYNTSNSFILDTKNPTNVSFSIDHSASTNQLVLATPSDDSSYQIAYSNLSDFSDATFENFPLDGKKTYSNLTSDPATVFVRVKDAKGNYATTSAITPAKPQHVVFYDVSNSVVNEYREFIAWDVVPLSQTGAGFLSYQIYRSKDNATYDLVGTITDRAINYFTDKIKDADPITTDSDPSFDPANPNRYYYKILIEDSSHDRSDYSSKVDDIPNGQGGTDQTPPTISNVKVNNVDTTSAIISWKTDELADSSVGYSEGTSYLPERGLASFVTDHSINLTGLTPGRTYNIRVKSHDLVGNLGQVDKDNPGLSNIVDFSFTTNPGPSILGVTIPSVSNNQATINWKTTTDSSSFIVYSDTVSGGQLVSPEEFGSPDFIGGTSPFTHSVTISSYGDQPLIPNTKYYFQVKSVDAQGNVAIDNNGGNFYELLTTADSDSPIISSIAVPIMSKDSVAISWVTNEPATSQVSYKKHSDSSYTDKEEVLVYDRSHYVILTGLSSDTEYDFKITSKDINTNASTSDVNNFTTSKDFEFQHDPLSKIDNISVPESSLRDTTAIITFNTDQPALCYIDLDSISTVDVTSAMKFEAGYMTDEWYNTTHAIPLSGLKALTEYSYDISCHDNIIKDATSETKVDKFKNWKEEKGSTFKTKEQLYTAAGAGALGDKDSPIINNVKVSSTTGESAIVTWDTNENSSSGVRFGLDSNYGNVSGNDLVNSSVSNYVTSHTVTINGLIPATKYLYKVTSLDTSGNIAESAESSFTTASPSSISSIKVESKNLGEATVTWSTSSETSSIVEYGLTTSYGEKKESSTLVKDHSIDLSSLNQGVTYHYRVKGKDADGKMYASSDQTFEPKSPPQISNISINDITEHGAIVSFDTNVPTDATVVYMNISDNSDNGSQTNSEISTKHSIQLKNLSQGSTFSIKIKARDEQGTESEQAASDLTTGKDENPPKIDMVKTDLALAQNDKVQAIISWSTDEQATTSIIYKEGRNGDQKEIEISKALTPSHIVVLTTFKPGTVYYFNTKSVDASGNISISTDYALLTPKRKENIIQIIISNFTEIFGWTNGVGR